MSTPEIPHVVLVHGLWFRESWLRVLGGRLEQAGYKVKGFSYHSTRMPLERSAKRLQHLCTRDYPNGVHLVGHSLGGLLILQMLETGHWTRPGRVLFLGTPLTGSAVARQASQWPGANLLLGAAADPLLDGVQHWPEHREIGMIAGSRPVGLGRLTGGLPQPNDGTVAVAETQHDGLKDHITMPVTHTGLIFSEPVSRQVLGFLATGQFEPLPPAA